MTIITHPICEKKLAKQKEPLVTDEDVVVSSIPSCANVEAGTAGSPLVVTMMRARARRISSLTTVCVFLTALLVLCTGIFGGVYIYRQFTRYRLRHFTGWCSIPYAEKQSAQSHHLLRMISNPDDANEREKMLNQLLDSRKGFMSDSHWAESEEVSRDNPKMMFDNYFDEEFDIDIEFEQYERIEIPDFSHGRRGRFIHDFSVNKTGIIDLDEGRCFLLALNRSMVLPPHSLFDLVSKMRSGYYDVDTEIIREAYRVVIPAVSDMRSVGYYIGRECAGLPTYRLEKVTSPVFKRSIDDDKGKTVFAEFAGRKINEINIINLGNAPGTKSIKN